MGFKVTVVLVLMSLSACTNTLSYPAPGAITAPPRLDGPSLNAEDMVHLSPSKRWIQTEAIVLTCRSFSTPITPLCSITLPLMRVGLNVLILITQGH